MPSQKQVAERLENLDAMLKVIRAEKKTTRKELMTRISLSWGCVSELVGLLIANGYVVEEKESTSGVKGRSPSMLALSENKKVLGIDVNKLGATYCVCDLYGKKLFEKTSPLRTVHKAEMLSDIFTMVEEARATFSDICAVGFAMQGIQDKKTGIWDFPGEKEITLDFKRDIAAKLDLPATVKHDPECMLLGRMENTENESKMLVRIDSGIGATVYQSGFFMGGLLELGYTVVPPDGERLHHICDTRKLEEMQNRKDYQSACARVGMHLGIALGNFCNMLFLNEIFICGEIVQYMDDIYPHLEKSYLDTVIGKACAKITVTRINNAAFGAARLALEALPYTLRRDIL